MFTTIDKAIAALIGSLIALGVLFGLPVPEFMQQPSWALSIAGGVSAVLTWAVPNKPKHGGGGGP